MVEGKSQFSGEAVTMKSSPQVSVCLPTYNRAHLLRECLSTILSQRFSDFELIVSDNCSTDSTADLVASVSDPRVSYHRNATNIGPYANMNRALGLARGAYVCVLHDDDLYAPEFLAREYEMLNGHRNVGMVHCAVEEIDTDGARRRTVRAYPRTQILEGKKEFVRFLEGHNVCCSSVMFRRELLGTVGFFDTRYLCADFLMWLKFALQGDVGYIAEPLVRMRVHSDTVTSWLVPARWHQEFVDIVEQGFELARTACPEAVASREALLRRAARAQGKRFLIAALAATARGDYDVARGYAGVSAKFEAGGAPRLYATLARASVNPVGRWMLGRLRRFRELHREGAASGSI